jgi:internalin A
MRRHFPVVVRLAVLLALAAILAAGCGKKEVPPRAGDGGQGKEDSSGRRDTSEKTDLPGPRGTAPPPVRPSVTRPEKPKTPELPTDVSAEEDPEVFAYFRKRGWYLSRSERPVDGVRRVYLVARGTLSDEDFKMIARSKSLQVLDLTQANTTDGTLQAVAAVPRLEGVFVKGNNVTDAGVQALARSRSLSIVALVQTEKVTGKGVKELATLPNLRMLVASFVTLDESAFEALGGAKTLEFLALHYVNGMNDEGVRHLANLPDLNVLKLDSGYVGNKLTTKGIKAIADVRVPAKFEFKSDLIDDDLLEVLVAKGWLYGPTPPGVPDKKPATPEEVKRIDLYNSKVTDRGMRSVLNCTNVTHVHLRKTGVTDETLRKLSGFKQLEYLALDETKVTAAGLDAVSGLPLKYLSLVKCELSEDAFKAFARMTALEQLWLSGTKMKAEWLKHISGLPKLKELYLSSADFDDTAVKYVTPLPDLETLMLNNTKLGDAGFQELLRLPKLRNLWVDDTKVSKEVYQKAKKEHPKISLSHYGYDR